MLVVVWKQRTTQHHVHSLRPNLYYHHFDSGFVVSDWMGSQWLSDRGTERSETRGPYAMRNNTGAVEVLISSADVGYARDAGCSVATERQATLCYLCPRMSGRVAVVAHRGSRTRYFACEPLSNGE